VADKQVKQRALGEVAVVRRFLREWDPIGVMGHEAQVACTSDEYDSYAATIHSLLRHGCAAADLAQYLDRVESEEMRLTPVPERNLALAIKITDWWARHQA